MKISTKFARLFRSVRLAFLALMLPAAPCWAAASPVDTQFDFSSDTTPGARKFAFQTIPGRSYRLWRSTDLQSWSAVAGYPRAATGLAIEHTFNQLEKEFFRIESIDGQPPEMVTQFPGVDAYAVRRFDDLHFQLSDATGIAPASIRLSVGGGAEMAIGAAGLSFSGDVLTYDSGDAALGVYGASVPVTLTVADVLGHSLTHTFTFSLEVLPKIRSNLFVFGSPTAQRAGQTIPATPTAALAARSGPVAMGGASPWSIGTVLADRVVIGYTGDACPQFVAGSYLTNLTPVRVTDIFYRIILGTSDDPGAKQLTLMTEDVPFADIVEEGSSSLSSQSVFYSIGDGGLIQPAAEISFSQAFPRVGINRDGAGPLALPGSPRVSVTLPEAHLWFTPSLEISFETKGFAVQRASIQARGDVDAALVPRLNYRPGTESQKKIDLHAPVSKLTFIGSIGPVPVWVDWKYSTSLDLSFEANADISLRAGFRRNFSVSAAAQYQKDATPSVSYPRSFTLSPLQEVPITLSVGGTVQAKVAIVPQLEVRLQSLIGFYVNVDPRFELEITASGAFSYSQQDGRFTMAPGGTATIMGGVFADLNAGLSVIGVDQSELPAMAPIRLLTRSWERNWPTAQPLTFSSPTAEQSLTVPLGGTISLEGMATGGDGAISYQWLHHGVPLPGQTERQLVQANATAGAAGTYTLRARGLVEGAVQSVVSPPFTVTVAASPLTFSSPTAAQSLMVPPGGTIRLEGMATGGDGTILYQWLYNGVPIPGRNTRHFVQANAAAGAAGTYTLQAQGQVDGATQSVVSPPFTVTVSAFPITFSSPTAAQSLTVPPGGTISLEGMATGGEGAILYQWLYNGVPIPGQTARQLVLANAAAEATGTYTLRAEGQVDGAIQSVVSPPFTVTVSAPTPAGFSLIPAGTFTMGDPFGGPGNSAPLHTVTLSAFYMGQTEVTLAQWQATYILATANGYTFDNQGLGTAANHPVHTVNWHDVVKWCNARSQQEGLTPCYTVSGATYKTGQSAAVCDFTRNGYRLPTEAEWEKAARGGLTGQRFPWGNTITHSQANYSSTTIYAYDTSPTRGYHPTYRTASPPYTSPVGSFAPNGYGLYDMTGNIWEWCYDWNYTYPDSGGTNYTGPDTPLNLSGWERVLRGGSWRYHPDWGSVSFRGTSSPAIDVFETGHEKGFRLARSSH